MFLTFLIIYFGMQAFLTVCNILLSNIVVEDNENLDHLRCEAAEC